MMCKKSAYVITKPLQYINATNILDSNKKDCYLCDNFSSFNQFIDSIKSKSLYWDEIFTSSDKHKALLKIVFHRNRYSKVFLDSDFGIIVRLLLLLLYPINIYVYEEGFASYTPSLRIIRNIGDRILQIIDYLMGGKSWSGGAIMTRGIFLYHKEAFLTLIKNNTSKELLSFKNDFLSHLSSLKEINYLLQDVDFNYFRDKKIVIYISAWKFNPEFNSVLKLYPGYLKVLKPHPHNTEEIQLKNNFDIIINNIIPAEILISKIAYLSQSLIIIHEGSACMLNVPKVKNVTEYNIAPISKQEEYSIIQKAFLESRSLKIG